MTPRFVALNLLIAAFGFASSSTVNAQTNAVTGLRVVPFINSNLPEEERALIESALNRLNRESNKLDGKTNAPSGNPSTSRVGSDPTLETDPTDGPATKQDPEVLKKWALEQLDKNQAEQSQRLAPEERRRLDLALKGDKLLNECLEEFLKAPFDIEEPEKHIEFVQARSKLINLLFSAPEDLSNRRHFVVNHYRLFQKDALARFRNFDKVFQLRYDAYSDKIRSREKFIGGAITLGGAVVGFMVGWKFFKTPLASDAKFPLVAKAVRIVALTALPILGYKVGDLFSADWAPLVTRSIWSVREPFSNDPQFTGGSLDELILLDRKLQK